MTFVDGGIHGNGVEGIKLKEKSNVAGGDDIVAEVGSDSVGGAMGFHLTSGSPVGGLATNHRYDGGVEGLAVEIVHAVGTRDTRLSFAKFVAEFKASSEGTRGNGVDCGAAFFVRND